MHTHRTRNLFILSILLFLGILPGFAQLSQGTATSATNYYFAKANELTLIVSVMGFVQRPGRYEISSTRRGRNGGRGDERCKAH